MICALVVNGPADESPPGPLETMAAVVAGGVRLSGALVPPSIADPRRPRAAS